MHKNVTNHQQNKAQKGSMFNARASTGGRGINTRDKVRNQAIKIREYSNMNRSSMTNKKTRPATYGDKSRINTTENIGSLSNLHSNNKSFSKKRLLSNKSKRSESKRKLEKRNNEEKEQEILITKTYDLTLSIHKKSNNKKISYVNKYDKE